MAFPRVRLRRLRASEGLRQMMRVKLDPSHFIFPLFVVSGRKKKVPISAMPGQFRYSKDELLSVCQKLLEAGVKAVLLFGIPEKKDSQASESYNPRGVVQQAVREIKKHFPEIVVITDVCVCAYTDHGHCGVLKKGKRLEVDNDRSLELLQKQALSHAASGADMVAPSAMMDGQVAALREALDEKGFVQTGIMAYAAKFASSFYGPFREAAASAPKLMDRSSYQMGFFLRGEAMREIELDIEEGADVVMVKPALSYLDILFEAHLRFDLPLAGYNVSGEYAMIKAAAEKGWLDEKKTVMETLTAIKRAGCHWIITYWALQAAHWLRDESS